MTSGGNSDLIAAIGAGLGRNMPSGGGAALCEMWRMITLRAILGSGSGGCSVGAAE